MIMKNAPIANKTFKTIFISFIYTIFLNTYDMNKKFIYNETKGVIKVSRCFKYCCCTNIFSFTLTLILKR